MEKLRNIKGIFFDLGGTLIYPPSGSFMFSRLARKYFPLDKLRSAPPEAAAAARELASRELAGGFGAMTVESEYNIFLSYYTALAGELGLELSPEELKAVTDDKVHNPENYCLFEDAAETIKALSGRYRLGIISDTWPSVLPVLEHFDILKYFECTTFSYELGALKPDSRMFFDALAKLGLPAGQTVFVDDNPHNLAGAAAFGVEPVQICADLWSPGLDRHFGIDGLQLREKVSPAGTDLPGDMPRIGHISELLELLDI